MRVEPGEYVNMRPFEIYKVERSLWRNLAYAQRTNQEFAVVHTDILEMLLNEIRILVRDNEDNLETMHNLLLICLGMPEETTERKAAE